MPASPRAVAGALPIRIQALLVVSVLLLSSPARAAGAEDQEFSASGFDSLRIEQEEKLLVPLEKADEVWEFLRGRYVDDPEVLRSIDPLFTSYHTDEDFTDVYFDTPTLELLGMQSGVRHRTRVNLTNPHDRKSGRELMQIKLSGVSDNTLERGEIKFPIEHLARVKEPEDMHPMLGIVKRSHREDFKRRLVKLGLDPQAMRPILTVHDLRSRAYVLRAGKPFMSISLDRASSRLWWAQARFVEIEPELNEIAFTDADDATRRSMEGVLARIVGEIRDRFPEIRSDLTPKYNKSFASFERQIPALRLVVRANLHDAHGMWLVFVIAGFAVLVAGFAAWTIVARRLRFAVRIPSGLEA